jgi:mRNA interferase RelE/StbE
MIIIQSHIFEQKIKKFSKNEKEILDRAIREIINNPVIGQEKKGDLKDVFIHKFKIKVIQYLIAYRIVNKTLELIMIGPHENYYKDLKRYLKSK